MGRSRCSLTVLCPVLPGRTAKNFIFSGLSEHDRCQIKLQRKPANSGKKNGAVSEDCAAPHENPNLTNPTYSDREHSIPFKRQCKKIWQAGRAVLCPPRRGACMRRSDA